MLVNKSYVFVSAKKKKKKERDREKTLHTDILCIILVLGHSRSFKKETKTGERFRCFTHGYRKRIYSKGVLLFISIHFFQPQS